MDAILTLNAGSSSIKFALFRQELEPCRMAHGAIENIGSAPHLRAFDAQGTLLTEKHWTGGTHENFLDGLLSWIEDHLAGDHLVAAGHRIVHGGDRFVDPCALDKAAVAALEEISPLAPLHQPHNLNAVKAIAALRPGLPQFGCFDTAFHRTIEPTARRYGLPRALEEAGVRKYGFHGLSYEYIAGRLREVAPDQAQGRVIVAHLGSGASLCAMRDSLSCDTTMGFSPLDGLVMATRCGALDPGILLYLLRQGKDVTALEEMLYDASGLFGVSGISGDMRVLLSSHEIQAREAIDLFVFRVAREVGALVAILGGVDAIVFTAGIGENSSAIRRLICARLAWLGLMLDEAANTESRTLISASASRLACWVIPTDEESVIARHTIALLTCTK
jgi:acetate kinase